MTTGDETFELNLPRIPNGVREILMEAVEVPECDGRHETPASVARMTWEPLRGKFRENPSSREEVLRLMNDK